MIWRGRKIHKILFKFREEESSSRVNYKINKIQNELQLFYWDLFKSNCTKSYYDCVKFLDKIITPALTSD